MQNLEKLHVALSEQDFKDYEIIYVDDGSTDRSWEILQTLSKEENVRCFKLEKNYPVGYARAFGVEKAKGDFIASIDADCTPQLNWLDMVKYLDENTAVVGFPVIPPAELDYLAQKFDYIGDGKPNLNVHLHGSGVIMRKDIVSSAGNYPSKKVGEDNVLFKNILKARYKLKYTDEVKRYHGHKQQNFAAFLKRFYRAGENNTSGKTFLFFDVVFPLLLLFSFMFVYYLGPVGLLSLILPVGFLSNPETILFYMGNFAKPKNKALKFILFTGIKITVSIAFVLGLWRATINKLIF